MIDPGLRSQLDRLPAADAVDHPPVRKALLTLDKARREHDQAQETENAATAAVEEGR